MLIWLVAIVLFVALLQKHKSLKKLQEQLDCLSDSSTLNEQPPESSPEQLQVIQNLLVLRLELICKAQAGQLEEDSLPHLLDQIDENLRNKLKDYQLVPDSIQWHKGSLKGWRILSASGYVPPGPPPWEKDPSDSDLLPDIETPVPSFENDHPEESETTEVCPQSFSSEPSRYLQKIDSIGASLSANEKNNAEKSEQTINVTHEIAQESGKDHAWEPREPSELEKALHHISGWPKAILPFLVQNVGWFLGGFCFLAGSIFLVSYTTGFAKGLAVFAALFLYTLFLIWFGYHLQLKKLLAKTGSDVLMTMGILLMPLNISAAVRLIVNNSGSLWFSIVGCLAAVLAIGIYYYLAKLIAGLVDRTLQGVYSVIFLLLTSVQLGVPLLIFWPTWQLMACFHLLLLGLLSYGFYCYVHDWMRSIFVEQKKIAYFAGGVLLYTTCVSFVHLTWAVEFLQIPQGYYAPYLMAVCGLLFYVESQFKQWAHQNVFLSRFTFLIYGLSILALVLATNTPTMIMTLLLAIIIYALVVWQFLTVIPLYLLLASLAGLYQVLILSYFSWDFYLLLSVPGLAGLFLLSNTIHRLKDGRFAVYRLAKIVYQVQAFLLFALGAWSLFNSQPGIIGFSTALLIAAGSWWTLRSAPGSLLTALSKAISITPPNQERINLNNSPWFYTVTLSLASAMAFLPNWLIISWSSRFSLGLMLLACICAWQAIRYRLLATGELAARVEVLSNSALLNVVLALALVYPFHLWDTGGGLFLPLLCILGACVLLRLSLGLYVRWLFYGFLLLICIAVWMLKLKYFPGASTGTMKTLVALGLWFGLWWLEGQSDEFDNLRRERLQQDTPLHLLWLFPVCNSVPNEVIFESCKVTEGGTHV